MILSLRLELVGFSVHQTSGDMLILRLNELNKFVFIMQWRNCSIPPAAYNEEMNNVEEV